MPALERLLVNVRRDPMLNNHAHSYLLDLSRRVYGGDPPAPSSAERVEYIKRYLDGLKKNLRLLGALEIDVPTEAVDVFKLAIAENCGTHGGTAALVIAAAAHACRTR